MLEEGMKALVIGARTPVGQQYIGCEVVLMQRFVHGSIIDQPFAESPVHYTSANDGVGWVVYREGVLSSLGSLKENFLLFNEKHLMPIPPLEDPGIDECTFTPIVQKEVV